MSRFLLACTMALPMGLHAQPESEPNNSIQQANVISEGTPFSGQIIGCTMPLDITPDYFRLTTSQSGALRIRTQFANSITDALPITVSLLNENAGLVQSFAFQAGSNGVTALDSAISDCREQGIYYVVVNYPGLGSCTTYELEVEVLPPVFAQEAEPNNSTQQALPLPLATPVEGRVNFLTYGDAIDWYRLDTPDDGVLNITVEAENRGNSGTMQLALLNSTAGLLQNFLSVAVGGNSSPATTQLTSLCRGDGTYYLTVTGAPCGTSYRLAYTITEPLYAEDVEDNDITNQADTVLAGMDHEGRLNFTYDDNFDTYRLILPSDGVLSVTVDAEQAGSNATDSLTVTLLNSAGGLIRNWRAGVGANGVPNTQVLQRACLGNEQLYFLQFSSTACGTSYRFSYAVSPPLFADDLEENDNTDQADTVLAGVDHEGRLNFTYDDNFDTYRLILPSDGVLSVTVDAEQAGSNATDSLTVTLLNSAGGLIRNWRAGVGANGVPNTQVLQRACLGNEQLYFLQSSSTACGTSYRFSYEVSPPLFADDLEENDNTDQADTVLAGVDHEGRLNFIYDDNTDTYRLILPSDGILNITFDAEHAGPQAGGTLIARLLNSTGGLLQNWTANVGAEGDPTSQVLSMACRGDEQFYFLQLQGSSVCGTSYRFNYDVTPPVFGDDAEPNQNIQQAIPFGADAQSAEGRLDFFYDNAIDWYRIELPAAGIVQLEIEAENAGASGSMDLILLNGTGGLVQQQSMPVGGNSTPSLGTFTSNALAAGTYFVQLLNAPCGTSYRILCNDDDGDGTCNALDQCPGGLEPGSACDDGDPATMDDTIGTDCVCAGDLSTGIAEEDPGNTAVRMWPNPNRSEQLWIDLSGIEQGVSTVAIDIFDLAGKRLVAREIATQGDRLNTVIELNGDLANGVYLIGITAGEKRYTERLVITR